MLLTFVHLHLNNCKFNFHLKLLPSTTAVAKSAVSIRDKSVSLKMVTFSGTLLIEVDGVRSTSTMPPATVCFFTSFGRFTFSHLITFVFNCGGEGDNVMSSLSSETVGEGVAARILSNKFNVSILITTY